MQRAWGFPACAEPIWTTASRLPQNADTAKILKGGLKFKLRPYKTYIENIALKFLTIFSKNNKKALIFIPWPKLWP
jgi:hypothetical protein